MLRSLFPLLICLVVTLPANGEGLAWVELFNGADLSGWSQRNGTANYRVEGDSIVGTTSEGSPNSFLCTDKAYGDFELKFEVKVDSALNSGVQIRSQSKNDTPSGRVNGPQVEIATNGNAGYVYGEAAGGWMTPDHARQRHDYFRDGDWNAFHVIAQGNRIRVWINGHQVSDLKHDEKFESHPSGFIGLQVHGIKPGEGPYEVRWRNLMLRDLTGFQPMLNGTDLSGWTTTGNWTLAGDGSLLIQPRPGEKGWKRFADYLWSDKSYGDFVLDLEYAYPPGGNSGLFFRVGDVTDPVAQGIEIQILDNYGDEKTPGPHDHGGVIKTVGPAENMSLPPHQWNRMFVSCLGSHLQVELNGKQIIDTQLDEGAMKDRPLVGFIGLQDHGEPNNIRFRNLRIKEVVDE